MTLPPKRNEDTLIIEVLSVPSERIQDLPRVHTEWLSASLPRRVDGTPMLKPDAYAAMHPLYSRVVGFAAARVRRDGKDLRICSCWADATDELGVLDLAGKVLADHKGMTVGFSGSQATMRILLTRMLFLGERPRVAERTLLRRHLDVADLLSWDGTLAVPTREQVLEVLGLSNGRQPLSVEVLCDANHRGDADIIEGELLWRVEEVAGIYARLCCRPDARITGSVIAAFPPVPEATEEAGLIAG